jgi:hypothetical protein
MDEKGDLVMAMDEKGDFVTVMDKKGDLGTVMDKKGDLVTDCHSILASRGTISLSVHGATDVRQTKIHTAEPLGPDF